MGERRIRGRIRLLTPTTKNAGVKIPSVAAAAVISFPPHIDYFSGSAEVSGVLHLQWIAIRNGPTRPHVTALAMYCTPDRHGVFDG
jgi:hypothetical protein